MRVLLARRAAFERFADRLDDRLVGWLEDIRHGTAGQAITVVQHPLDLDCGDQRRAAQVLQRPSNSPTPAAPESGCRGHPARAALPAPQAHPRSHRSVPQVARWLPHATAGAILSVPACRRNMLPIASCS
jgi:hypothetical protein